MACAAFSAFRRQFCRTDTLSLRPQFGRKPQADFTEIQPLLFRYPADFSGKNTFPQRAEQNRSAARLSACWRLRLSPGSRIRSEYTVVEA
jgi:hypothetical protein